MVGGAQTRPCAEWLRNSAFCSDPNTPTVDADSAKKRADEIGRTLAVAVSLGEYFGSGRWFVGQFAILDGYIAYVLAHPAGDRIDTGQSVWSRFGGKTRGQRRDFGVRRVERLEFDARYLLSSSVSGFCAACG